METVGSKQCSPQNFSEMAQMRIDCSTICGMCVCVCLRVRLVVKCGTITLLDVSLRVFWMCVAWLSPSGESFRLLQENARSKCVSYLRPHAERYRGFVEAWKTDPRGTITPLDVSLRRFWMCVAWLSPSGESVRLLQESARSKCISYLRPHAERYRGFVEAWKTDPQMDMREVYGSYSFFHAPGSHKCAK